MRAGGNPSYELQGPIVGAALRVRPGTPNAGSPYTRQKALSVSYRQKTTSLLTAQNLQSLRQNRALLEPLSRAGRRPLSAGCRRRPPHSTRTDAGGAASSRSQAGLGEGTVLRLAVTARTSATAACRCLASGSGIQALSGLVLRNGCSRPRHAGDFPRPRKSHTC